MQWDDGCDGLAAGEHARQGGPWLQAVPAPPKPEHLPKQVPEASRGMRAVRLVEHIRGRIGCMVVGMERANLGHASAAGTNQSGQATSSSTNPDSMASSKATGMSRTNGSSNGIRISPHFEHAVQRSVAQAWVLEQVLAYPVVTDRAGAKGAASSTPSMSMRPKPGAALPVSIPDHLKEGHLAAERTPTGLHTLRSARTGLYIAAESRSKTLIAPGTRLCLRKMAPGSSFALRMQIVPDEDGRSVRLRVPYRSSDSGGSKGGGQMCSSIDSEIDARAGAVGLREATRQGASHDGAARGSSSRLTSTGLKT